MFRGIVILNGGSSSGKSTLAAALRALLEEPWLAFGIDDFLEALPPWMRDSLASIQFQPGGEIVIGEDFRLLERAWMLGIAEMVRAGANVVVTDGFLSGRHSQDRWRDALGGLPTRFIAVRCDAEVAAAREAERPDRATGIAATQADSVHRGIVYDFSVDTSRTGAITCARAILEYLAGDQGDERNSFLHAFFSGDGTFGR